MCSATESFCDWKLSHEHLEHTSALTTSSRRTMVGGVEGGWLVPVGWGGIGGVAEGSRRGCGGVVEGSWSEISSGSLATEGWLVRVRVRVVLRLSRGES
eukprot:4570005-Prymnesium_polylepis.1